MTDAFHGADVAALRTQAVALHDAAQTLVTCAQRTGRGLDALTWAGRDADRARIEDAFARGGCVVAEGHFDGETLVVLRIAGECRHWFPERPAE